MNLRSTFALAAILLVGCESSKAASTAPPPPQVVVTQASVRDVPLFIEAVGTLDGYDNAEIRARVRGYLKSQNYKDGAAVKEGQLLFTIEPTEFQAALTTAKAALERALAAQSRAHAAVERDRPLVPNTVSQADMDNAVAAELDANAQVDAARAQIQQADLNLSYTTMHSPVTGVAGLALVRVGNLVGQDGPTLLTTVSQIDPIRVNFPMSEADYLRAQRGIKALEGRDLAWAKAQFSKLADGGKNDDDGIELVLADGSTYARRGVIVTANRQMDSSTGTIQMQALFPNGDGFLRPGAYGRVRIRRREAGENSVVVPERALVQTQGVYSLAIVGAGNKIELRHVEVGPTTGSVRIITKGIVAGETVVLEGLQKVNDGTIVSPQAAPPPSASVASNAADAGR